MTSTSPLPRQWLIAGALFGGVVIALASVYFLWVRQDYAVLYQDLREDDAAAITRTLEAQRIPYRLGNGGADILVPASDLDQIRLDIASSDVAINGLEGFELFDQSDMGLNDFGQRIRYQRALQGELARTIMRMDGVVDARVHLYIPERSLFRAERQSAEAAVTLVTRRAQDLTPARVDGIRRLVAAAVANLSPADVVVLDGRGQPLAGSPDTEAQNNAVSVTAPAIDPIAELSNLARDAAQRAIPYRRFELQFTPPETTLEGAETFDAEVAQPTSMTLITESSLSQDERNRVAAEFDRSDLGREMVTLTFAVGPLAPVNATPAPLPPPPATLSASDTAAAGSAQPTSAFSIWVWIAFVSAALLGALAIAWVLLRPRLSREQRRSFAQALSESLEENTGAARDGL